MPAPIRHLNFKSRTRLPAADHAHLNQPVAEALQAFRLGTGCATHQATLAAALSVAYRLAESIPRHRHLLVEIQPALNALTAIYDRAAVDPECDCWLSTDAEIVALEFAAEIYQAILVASSASHVRRAIGTVMRES